MNRIQECMRNVATLIRRITGMPDYRRYVAHLRDKHPECPVPSETEYYELYLDGRYNRGGGRCC